MQNNVIVDDAVIEVFIRADIFVLMRFVHAHAHTSTDI